MRKSTVPIIYKKLMFIVNSLLRYHRLTLEEISQLWLNDLHTDEIPFERKSYYRYCAQIEEMFGISIKSRKDGNYFYYSISNPEDLGASKLYSWSIAAMQAGDLLLHSKNLYRRILLEEFPSENGKLQPIIEAMQQSVYVTLRYKKYQAAEEKEYHFAPYLIKQYKQRLYVVGLADSLGMRAFSLDRITGIQHTAEPFQLPKKFDAQTYFEHVVGIMVDEEKYPPQKVVLQAIANEACYLNDVPLHHSQRIVEATDQHTTYSYYMSVTEELKGYILSRGNRLKVIEPQTLCDEIRDLHLQSAEEYK